MGVVKKLSDYRPSPEAVERKVAQLEDGFLRLANELLDATMCSGLPETELCIVMAVWRKTYGYSKKMDWISNEQLEEMIGKHLTHCSTAKTSLVRKKVLLQEGRKVGMNTNISEWETKNNGFCKTLAKPAKKTLAEVANGPSQKLLTTKDNIQKTINKTPLTPQGDEVETKSKSNPEEHEQKSPGRKKKRQDPLPVFDRERFKDTWNSKADKHGLPKIRSVTTTTEQGLSRLWASYLKQCKELGTQPKEIDAFLNGYIEFGYKPTAWSCGANPEGKKYGIDTALTQTKIDQVLGEDV